MFIGCHQLYREMPQLGGADAPDIPKMVPYKRNVWMHGYLSSIADLRTAVRQSLLLAPEHYNLLHLTTLAIWCSYKWCNSDSSATWSCDLLEPCYGDWERCPPKGGSTELCFHHQFIWFVYRSLKWHEMTIFLAPAVLRLFGSSVSCCSVWCLVWFA